MDEHFCFWRKADIRQNSDVRFVPTADIGREQMR
jgi:hypothetical protein